MNVHGPSQFLVALSAEFAPRHEHDVVEFGQRCDGVRIQQIAGDGLDAPGFELAAHGRVAETGDANDAFVGSGAFGQAGQRRSHLAADAEHHDVALQCRQIVDQRLARQRHEILKRLFILEGLRGLVRC